MPPELTQEEKDEIAAFNKAIGMEESTDDAPPAGDEPAGAETPPAGDEPAGDKPAVEEEPPEGADMTGDDGGEGAEGAPAAGADDPSNTDGADPKAADTAPTDDEAAKLRKANEDLQREIAELKKPKGAPAPTTEAAPPANEKPEDGAAEEPTFEFSADQKEAIDELEKEWPGLKKAIDAREAFMTFQFQQAQEKAFKDFATQLQNYLAPLVGTHVQSAQEKHLVAVKAAVPDYDEIVDLLPEWIGKKPGKLKEVYAEAYESGTTEEVIELLKAFKQETGRVQPQEQNPNPNAAAAAPAAPPKKTEPPAEKVNALTAVKGGGRTSPKPAAGPKDLTEEEAFNLAIGAR